MQSWAENKFLYCYSISIPQSGSRESSEIVKRNQNKTKFLQLYFVDNILSSKQAGQVQHYSSSFYCNDKSTDCTAFVCSLWIFKLTIQMMKLKQLKWESNILYKYLNNRCVNWTILEESICLYKSFMNAIIVNHNLWKEVTVCFM